MYPGRVSTLIYVLVVVGASLSNPPRSSAKRRFTVADDIGLAHFASDPVAFSPDSRYFTVVIERGLLDQNRSESTLRVFLTDNVYRFLLSVDVASEPLPVMEIVKSTYKDGPIIANVRWLADSSGIAFLAKNASGNDQLFLADIKTQMVQPLTSMDQDVTAFDIRDRNHVAYTIRSSLIKNKANAETPPPYTVGTGNSLYALLFPIDYKHDRSELWAIVDGKLMLVEDNSSMHPISLYTDGQQSLALSPDGRSVVTALAVETVPQEWETLYAPPLPTYPYHIRAGRQDLQALDGSSYVSEYALIDLVTGKVKPLTNAPTGSAAGWWAIPSADWSLDGRFVALSGTFLRVERRGQTNYLDRPCVAVVDVLKDSSTCLEHLRVAAGSIYEEGYHLIKRVRFDSGTARRLIVLYYRRDSSVGSLAFMHSDKDDSWDQAPITSDARLIDVSVRQSLNSPPVLVANDGTTRNARIIWDPNPQMLDIDLGVASVFRWTDKTGRGWIGGLYKPPDYVQGRRYPLVVQNHGFAESYFIPSGAFPTAFAAQELAASGIVVLQVQDCVESGNPNEGPCQVAGYEAAVKRLVGDGLVDPNSIGIVGFSRTCYYVMEALTTSELHFKAASITDGINAGYLQYIVAVDTYGNAIAHEYDAMIGARPFGDGLRQWLKRSPEFNMDKITTPLQVVALGHASLLGMWEPYAALRFLDKPVDLLVLATGAHVLTNPTDRLVSQGATVDWFRFWLKGEEDSDPAKREQYARWREMRNHRSIRRP